MRNYGRTLDAFAASLKRRNLDLKDVTWDVIMSHISSLERRKDDALSELKSFFRYLYDNNVVADSFAELFRSVHLPKEIKLPSVYTVD